MSQNENYRNAVRIFCKSEKLASGEKCIIQRFVDSHQDGVGKDKCLGKDCKIKL